MRNRARRLARPFPLPAGTVVCGELTLDPSQPYNDVIAFPSTIPLDIRPIDVHNIHQVQGSGVGADFEVQLMTFLRAQARALHLDHVEITVPKGTKYLVRDSGGAFKRACGNTAVQDWLKEHVIDEGRKAAMIVGVHTYSNASYKQAHRGQLGVGMNAIDAGNVGLSGGFGAAGLDFHAFDIPEEQIFAIEYRPIRFKPWTKKKLENAGLDPGQNRFEVFFGDRSKGAAGEEKENIFEFDLDDVEKDSGREGEDNDEDEGDELDDSEGDESESLEFDGSSVHNEDVEIAPPSGISVPG